MTEYKPRLGPNGKITASGKQALALMEGKEVQSDSLTYGILKKLERHGYRFKKRKEGRSVFYSLATKPQQSEPQPGDAAAVGPTADPPVLPVLPQLGQSGEVVGLAVNPDGSYNIGIRNGKRAWVRECDSCGEVRPCKRVKGTKFWLCLRCRDKQGLGVFAAIYRGGAGFAGR